MVPLLKVPLWAFRCQVFEVYRYTWKAYPKLQPLPPEQWASFRRVVEASGRNEISGFNGTDVSEHRTRYSPFTYIYIYV